MVEWRCSSAGNRARGKAWASFAVYVKEHTRLQNKGKYLRQACDMRFGNNRSCFDVAGVLFFFTFNSPIYCRSHYLQSCVSEALRRFLLHGHNRPLDVQKWTDYILEGTLQRSQSLCLHNSPSLTYEWRESTYTSVNVVVSCSQVSLFSSLKKSHESQQSLSFLQALVLVYLQYIQMLWLRLKVYTAGNNNACWSGSSYSFGWMMWHYRCKVLLPVDFDVNTGMSSFPHPELFLPAFVVVK